MAARTELCARSLAWPRPPLTNCAPNYSDSDTSSNPNSDSDSSDTKTNCLRGWTAAQTRSLARAHALCLDIFLYLSLFASRAIQIWPKLRERNWQARACQRTNEHAHKWPNAREATFAAADDYVDGASSQLAREYRSRRRRVSQNEARSLSRRRRSYELGAAGSSAQPQLKLLRRSLKPSLPATPPPPPPSRALRERARRSRSRAKRKLAPNK